MIRNIQEIHASIVSQARRGPTGGPHNALSDFLAGLERKGRKRKGRRRNREGERGGKGNSQVTLIHNGSYGRQLFVAPMRGSGSNGKQHTVVPMGGSSPWLL